MSDSRRHLVRVVSLLAAAGAALTAFGPAAVAAPPPTQGPAQPMIIGGDTAQNPGYVTRFNGHVGNTTYFCTSTLIAERWVLTAKHCVLDDNDDLIRDIDLYVGSNQSNGGTHVKASDIYLYNDGDLALLKLDASGGNTFSRLASSSSDAAVGDDATVYGWGATRSTNEGQNQSPVLKQAAVTISSLDSTDTFGGQAIELRTNTSDGAVAGGDSGGPLVDNGVQVGVSSTSNRSTVADYASVIAGRAWIRQVSGV